MPWFLVPLSLPDVSFCKEDGSALGLVRSNRSISQLLRLFIIGGDSVHTTVKLAENRERVKSTTVGRRASVFPGGDCQLYRSISAVSPGNNATMEWSAYRSSWLLAGEFEVWLRYWRNRETVAADPSLFR